MRRRNRDRANTASCLISGIRPDPVSEVCRPGDHLLAIPFGISSTADEMEPRYGQWRKIMRNFSATSGHHMTDLDRRQLMLAGAAVLLGSQTAIGQSGAIFTYRGITVDTSAAQDLPIIKEIVGSLKHQIDIVVECGAKPEIMTFFKSQPVSVKPGQVDGGGHFSSRVEGVTVDAAVFAPEKPVLLHELLHAYHFRVLPGALQNPDLLRFYGIAKQNELYPPDAYVLKNVQEFFAVTGSLYLWGNVDRPPNDRATLHDKQPVYYQWLGDLFGVRKKA